MAASTHAQAAVPTNGDLVTSAQSDSEYEESEYSDDTEASHDSAVTLEAEGVIINAIESSYVSPSAPTFNYDSRTPAQLRNIVRARGLKDPSPKCFTLKYYYIMVLEKADRALRHFRFMDLPPEMRNIVYAELLTLPVQTCSKHCFCFPQILCASKQINREASDILYAVNPIMCNFLAICHNHGDDEEDYFHPIVNFHTELQTEAAARSVGQLPSGMTAFPDFFHRIQHLRICIDFEHCGGTICYDQPCSGPEYLRHCMTSLASFLMERHSLKKVEIVFRNETDDDDSCILYPLRRLRNIDSVEVHGELELDYVAAIETEMRMPNTGAAPANTLKQCALLLDEAKAWMDLAETVDLKSIRYHEAGLGKLYKRLQKRLEHDGFKDVAAEQATRKVTETLSERLALLSNSNLAIRMRKLAAASSAKIDYESA